MPITATSPSCRTHSWSFVKRTALMLKLLSGGNSVSGQRAIARHAPGAARRDRRADRGAEAATRHRADPIAGGIGDDRALARRGAPIGPDTDALACDALRELTQDDRRTGEAALGAPPFADRPGEPGLDRGRRLVDVMAVKAEPGFEAQRVARAQ